MDVRDHLRAALQDALTAAGIDPLPETIELEDVRGLIQCLRLDMDTLLDLGKPGTTTAASAAASATSGISRRLGGIFGN